MTSMKWVNSPGKAVIVAMCIGAWIDHFAFCLWQDWVGKEEFIRLVSTRWTDSATTVPWSIGCILWGLVLAVRLVQRGRGA